MVRSLSFDPYRLDSVGRAMIKKATLRTRMKASRKMALTAANPRRWLMNAVLYMFNDRTSVSRSWPPEGHDEHDFQAAEGVDDPQNHGAPR